MKKASIGVTHLGGVGPIEVKQITARGLALINAETQQPRFVIGETLRRGRETGASRKLARQILPDIMDAPRDPPRSGQKSPQVFNGIQHAPAIAA